VDGSTIEFSPEGWQSDDQTKMDWLNEMLKPPWLFITKQTRYQTNAKHGC
jgi:hypothetical protein